MASLYKLGVMIARRQTRSTIHLAVLAALLLGCLALAEFPELLQLRDDTSNDFTLLASRQEVLSADVTTKFGPNLAAALFQDSRIHWNLSGRIHLSIPDPIAQSSIDYLHLLCVHRT
jgi:hypothetical protein